MSSEFDRRYGYIALFVHDRERFELPCGRGQYTRIVRELLPRILGEIFNELGFDAWVNTRRGSGVHLKVYRDNNLVLVIRVLNWSSHSRLNSKVKNRIIENLSQFQCKRLLIYAASLFGIYSLRHSGIDLLGTGAQVLPQDFYDFFQEKRDTWFRVPYTSEVKEDIKENLSGYLRVNRLIS